MLHLIDKAALVAEIERRIAEHKRLELEHAKEEDFLCNHIQRCTLEKVLDFLDTLEVKDVDLEKEYKEFVEKDPVYNMLVNGIVGRAIAKHFFELGLKAQKGE